MLNQDYPPFVQFILKAVPIPPQKAVELVSHFKEITIPKHEFFLKAGKISNQYMFLEEGFMRAFTHDQNGHDVTTNFYGKNMVVFEVASLFHRTISKENIQAVTACKGLALTFEELNTLFHAVPEFREFGRAMLVNGFAALKQRMLSMINETAEERYANLLQQKPEVFQFAHLKDIATYLGVTDTSLSRIRKQFAKK